MAADKLTYPVKRDGDLWTHQEANSLKLVVNEHADELDALHQELEGIGALLPDPVYDAVTGRLTLW